MAELKKVKASMMNAIHDLPLLVARDEGFFRDEGLDVEILVTPGTGQHNSDDRALKDDIFKRGLEATYDQGQCDQFRMCEWGIMKRAVETIQEKNLRPAKIVALGSAMSSFAIVVDPRSGIYEPEQLKNVPIAVSQYNGSHFTMLKMMEGFIKREEIKIANHGTHRQRMEAVMSGKVKAASLQEPWISVAEAKGGRVIIESHSTRSEAAGDEMDGPTLAKMFRAEARAAEAIQKNPEKYRALHRGGGRRPDRRRRTSSCRASSTRRRRRIRASGSTTITTGRSAGAWCRPARPTRTRSTTAPGSKRDRWIATASAQPAPFASRRRLPISHASPDISMRRKTRSTSSTAGRAS